MKKNLMLMPLLEESVEESGGESMTGCAEPVRQYLVMSSTPVFSKVVFVVAGAISPSPKIL